jgi:hypothetical protein
LRPEAPKPGGRRGFVFVHGELLGPFQVSDAIKFSMAVWLPEMVRRRRQVLDGPWKRCCSRSTAPPLLYLTDLQSPNGRVDVTGAACVRRYLELLVELASRRERGSSFLTAGELMSSNWAPAYWAVLCVRPA